jgi:hypothetical protein
MGRPQIEDPDFFRRRYPRREFFRHTGVLYRGHYFICDGIEIGEGGMSFESDMMIPDGHQLVVHFHIPGGAFAFLRAEIRGQHKKQKRVLYRLAFKEVPLSAKRQIRAYVSGSAKPNQNYFPKAA